MHHPPRARSASNITVNGQPASMTSGPGGGMNININMGGQKAMGPVSLEADGKLTKRGVGARTEQDMMMQANGASNSTFANPKQNVQHFGLKEGMRVADFGSGSGAYTLELARAVGGSGRVYAVDVQRDLLTRIQNEATKQGQTNVEVVWSDIESAEGVGIQNNLLDAVVLSNTLFQVDNKIQVVKEAWRVLKPGGTLIIIEWSDSFGGLGPQQSDVITQAESTLICTDNGFAFKSEFGAGEHHYGLIFVKMVEGQTQRDAVMQSQQKEKDFIERTIAQELI